MFVKHVHRQLRRHGAVSFQYLHARQRAIHQRGPFGITEVKRRRNNTSTEHFFLSGIVVVRSNVVVALVFWLLIRGIITFSSTSGPICQCEMRLAFSSVVCLVANWRSNSICCPVRRAVVALGSALVPSYPISHCQCLSDVVGFYFYLLDVSQIAVLKLF